MTVSIDQSDHLISLKPHRNQHSAKTKNKKEFYQTATIDSQERKSLYLEEMQRVERKGYRREGRGIESREDAECRERSWKVDRNQGEAR